MEQTRRREVQEALIGWAVGALGRWAGVAADEWPAKTSDTKWLSNYGQLLSPAWQPDGRDDQLLSIFSLVQPPEGEAVQPVFVSARPLSLETILADGDGKGVEAGDLWQGFVGEFGRLQAGDGRFETFTHLFHKYAWSVPCT